MENNDRMTATSIEALDRLYKALLNIITVWQMRAAIGHPDNAAERELMNAMIQAEEVLAQIRVASP